MLFTFIGCNNILNKTPESIGEEMRIYETISLPKLEVTFDTKNISIEKCEYKWSMKNNIIVVDAAIADKIVYL